ncbi:MAG: UDP-N-acetylmuramate dehydrogenase [Acidimicrobiia bacterium]|nr:UDP-N-acetylmuramate dehydrogenase [Acidimicrobiia bacterium]
MGSQSFIDELIERLPGQVERNGSVGDLTTYRVGGSASVIVRIESVHDLETVRACTPPGTPFLVVGAGSNLLVSDHGFAGVVLQLGDEFATMRIEESVDDVSRVILGGACMLPRVARQVVAAGLTGFEWAVGVPGSVGGAIRMNAGGHGSDMAASVRRVSVYSMVSGGPTMWSAERCDFGYRQSRIGPDDVVLFAELELSPTGDHDGHAELSEIVAWRRANQPGGQNAGSVFANPPGDSAGRLIDECGLKGFRMGSARISEKHANFIQAEPGGSAADIAALIDHVRRRVQEQCGVVLKVENRLIGFEAERAAVDAGKGDR